MSNIPDTQVKVGIGAMVFKDGKILLAKRKGSFGAGEYAFPGGHLEYMESFADCAKREIAEECGIEVENIRFQFVRNDATYAPKHFVHIGLMADWKAGEPQVLEPEKSESWGWYDLDDLPTPLFDFCRIAIESYRSKQHYFDLR